MIERHPGACKTRLLPDDPADTDAFGQHENVAEALAGLLLDEDGGRTVGLVGGWGSGKSSVVRQMKAIVEGHQDRRVKVLTFDGWVHEGDSLRRALLQQGMTELAARDCGWIPEDKQPGWDSKLQALRGLREEVNTESSPVLLRYGKWMVWAGLVVPMGVALLGVLGKNGGWTSPWVTMLAVLLTLAPVLMLFWIAYLRRVDLIGNVPVEEDNPIHLLARTSKTTTKQTNLRSIQPSTIEFQETWSELLSDALAGDDSRRLVLVVDNLDRMSRSEARQLWSTLRLFFEFGSSNPPDWLSRFWLVVPFDLEAAAALWLGAVPPADGDEQEVGAESRPAGTDVGRELAHASLEKSFQCLFRLPPVRLSAWSSFLTDQLSAALPCHDPADFPRVVRVYRSLLAADETPVPRGIKVFVNDLGSIHRIWNDEIPLAAQAAYVAVCRRGDSNIDQVLRSSDSGLLRLAKTATGLEDLQSLLAAIHLCAEPRSAMQAIMMPEVSSALSRSEPAELSKWSGYEGFVDVLEGLLDQKADELVTNAASLVNLLANLSAVPPQRLPVSSMCVARVKELAWDRGALPLSDARVGDALGFLIDAATEEERQHLRRLWDASASQIFDGVDELVDDPPSPDVGRAGAWVRGARALRPEGADEAPPFTVTIPPSAFYALLAYMESSGDGDLVSALRINDSAGYSVYLGERISEGVAADFDSDALRRLSACLGPHDTEQLFDAVCLRLKSLETESDEEDLNLLQFLGDSMPGSRERLVMLSEEGVLAHYAARSDHHESAGVALALLLQSGMPGADIEFGDSQTIRSIEAGTAELSGEVAVAAATELHRTGSTEAACATAVKTGAQALMAAVLAHNMELLAVGQTVAASVLFGECRSLLESLGQNDLAAAVMQYPESEVVPHFSETHEALDLRVARILFQHQPHSRALEALTIRALASMDADAWDKALRARDPLFSLTLAAIEAGVDLRLGIPLKDAILADARLRLHRSVAASEHQYVRLAEALRQELRRNLSLDLLELAGGVTTKSAQLGHVLSVYGPLIREGVSSQGGPDLVVRRLIPAVLYRLKLDELKWAADFATGSRDELAQSEESAKAELAERLRAIEAQMRTGGRYRLLPHVQRLLEVFDR